MVRLIAAAIGGLIAGAAAVWLLSPEPQPASPETVVRDIVAVPKMSGADAENHRAANYTQLTTIEEIEALPTAFARAEALFALAGRSGPAELQALIFDANRIADDNGRRESLAALFFRLTEIEPESALALARTEYFRNERYLEMLVWQTWARMDLDAAIFAAKTQTTSVQQNDAAQGLFAAYGDFGNETIERIEDELGIAPNRETRSRYLYRLADRSPAEAIAFINSQPDGYTKSEYVSWLAHYLARRDPVSAEGYASLLTEARYRETFKGSVRTRAALENPAAELDRILASGKLRENVGPLHSAMRVLVTQDFEAALAYFEAIDSTDHRQMMGAVIAYEYAQKDPLAALTWARANDFGDHGQVVMEVLSTIARSDAQRALAEARLEKNASKRQQQVSMVINTIGDSDPMRAVALLESLDDQQLRSTVRQNFSLQWLQQDADAAIDWILSHDDQIVKQLLNNASWAVVRTDIDAAIRLLPKIDQGNRTQWRQMIVNVMAQDRSAAEALQFARKFENEPDYPQMQATIIRSVAENDIAQARYLADQLADARSRDHAYHSIIGQQAQSDPQGAMSLVNAIADEGLRDSAFAQVASQWHQTDPAGVTRWLSNLPAGSGRDQAVMHVAGQWHTTGREQTALINSIADADMRGMVKLRHAYAVARYDLVKARSMLDDPDISNEQRQQALSQLNQFGSNR